MFNKFKAALQQHITKLTADGLWVVPVDREVIYQIYLAAFPEHERQEYTCNCCKSFLRQYGGIVSIDDQYNMVSIWDNLDVPDLYKPVAKALADYVHTLTISDVFLTGEHDCGTDSNYADKTGITWEHFYFRTTLIGDATMASARRSRKDVFKRGLDGFKLEAIDQVLELIAANNLYRGKESEAALKEARQHMIAYDGSDNYAWKHNGHPIRNTSIGTLLTDLSEGMPLDVAVKRFEDKVSGTNYKRPKALVTTAMVVRAKEKLGELGYLGAMGRRTATLSDIGINNLVYTDNTTVMTDVFDEISVQVKTPKNSQVVKFDEFFKSVPYSKVELLVENKHLPNFAQLVIGPEPSMFKWDNTVSWAYTGGVTDRIKERVRSAGGKVDATLRVSLSWYNTDDLDIHCIEPCGNRISFSAKRSRTTGCLDVDMNASSTVTDPVENITWTHVPNGIYKILVHNYNQRVRHDGGFALQIEANGEMFDIEIKDSPSRGKFSDFELQLEWRDGELIMPDNLDSKMTSKTKWGIETNTFVKVKQMFLSPNHWNGAVGSKHYMFMLENCVSDEDPRAFFNEFLDSELDEHRKVFEIVGSKLKVARSQNELAGLGFAETIKNDVTIRVDGGKTFKLETE